LKRFHQTRKLEGGTIVLVISHYETTTYSIEHPLPLQIALECAINTLRHIQLPIFQMTLKVIKKSEIFKSILTLPIKKWHILSQILGEVNVKRV
jgi:hypothetical protein